jgi:hypothetical protein
VCGALGVVVKPSSTSRCCRLVAGVWLVGVDSDLAGSNQDGLLAVLCNFTSSHVPLRSSLFGFGFGSVLGLVLARRREPTPDHLSAARQQEPEFGAGSLSELPSFPLKLMIRSTHDTHLNCEDVSTELRPPVPPILYNKYKYGIQSIILLYLT